MPEPEVEVKQEEKPDTTALAIRRKDGSIQTVLKGADGRFAKRERKMVPTRDVTAEIRKFINGIGEIESTESGKMTRDSKSRLVRMMESLYKIVMEGSTDPKSMQAAVQAFEALMLRGHGKPALNDEEQDALKRAGIRTVFIAIPNEVKETESSNDIERPKLPSFASDLPTIDAEIVSETKKE